MNINGIIAEYNPFHNGHRYQMEESKVLTKADYTVVVMSGNFVQRGAPALVDKHTRTEAALKNGADLVIELPPICACSSAEYFAAGAISLLNKLNIVTHLCFGSECGDVLALQKIAEVLSKNSSDFQQLINVFLRQGNNYPLAREKALTQLYPHLQAHVPILSSPNNILGIEYMKQLMIQNSSITPVTISRIGAGYHELQPSNKNIMSASGIRNILTDTKDFSSLQEAIPKDFWNQLKQKVDDKAILKSDALSSLLYYKLLSLSATGYDKYLDVTPNLSDRIINQLNNYNGFDAFCELLKTKELTYSRISRCLLHILLDITKDDMQLCQKLGYAPYVRVLGFRKDSTELLSLIKRHSSIPILTKLADADSILAEDSLALLQKEILISQLYLGISATQSGKSLKNEYTISPIII